MISKPLAPITSGYIQLVFNIYAHTCLHFFQIKSRKNGSFPNLNVQQKCFLHAVTPRKITCEVCDRQSLVLLVSWSCEDQKLIQKQNFDIIHLSILPQSLDLYGINTLEYFFLVKEYCEALPSLHLEQTESEKMSLLITPLQFTACLIWTHYPSGPHFPAL